MANKSRPKETKERKAIKDKQNAVQEMASELKKRKIIVLLNLSKTPDKLVQQIRKRLKEKHGAREYAQLEKDLKKSLLELKMSQKFKKKQLNISK